MNSILYEITKFMTNIKLNLLYAELFVFTTFFANQLKLE